VNFSEGSIPVDQQTLDLLAEALDSAERVPAHLLDVAYSARLMAAVDAELARLVFDSRADAGAALLRRGAENQARLLSFSNDHVTLDVSLSADGQTILGEIFPVFATEVMLETRDGDTLSETIDEFGRFRVSSDATSFRLRVTGSLVTPWIDRE
jgi:hypothetical protein